MKFNRFIYINKVHLKALIVLFILINTPFHSKAQCPTPYASNVTSSCNQNVTITAVSTMGGVSHRWYTTASGGSYMTPRTSGCSNNYPCLENQNPYMYVSSITATSTTTYWVSTFNISTYCESSRVMVTGTIGSPPTVNISPSDNPTNVCSLNTNFTLTASSGTSYQWKKTGLIFQEQPVRPISRFQREVVQAVIQYV